jgi:CheY-like chemotaxis protein
VSEATVLIVDDHESGRKMYAKALQHYGYRVLQAADGAEGVEVARAEKPDLILMDIAMPVLDAWGAMRLLQESAETASIPVVALTGFSSEGDRAGAVKAGFKGFLPKPCEPQRVLEEVRRLIGAPELVEQV